jgi:ABC-type nitrate/sulfonate/bicarbonate transport system substrate-binding protein
MAASPGRCGLDAEPFARSTEEQFGARDISDLDSGAVMGFPLVGYAATRAWEQRYPRTQAAFLRALEKGQQVADTDRAAVERAMEALLDVRRRWPPLWRFPSTFSAAWIAPGCSASST